MKFFIAALQLLLCSIATFAQDNIPAFGKIEKADLLLNECSFDKDASAYKLLDYGDVHYVKGKNYFKIQTEHRVRIKFLKEEGLSYSSVKIKFYTGNGVQNITDVAGATYNLDDKGNISISKLEKASVYTRKIDKNYSEVAFALPSVKVGSIIEYKYFVTNESITAIDNWDFQDNIPTRLSAYDITVPLAIRFETQIFAYQPVEQKNEVVHESLVTDQGIMRYNSTARSYILKNVPALSDEPFMSSWKDYVQRVVFQFSGIDANGNIEYKRETWPEISKSLLFDEDFGFQLNKTLPHNSDLDGIVKNAPSEYDKMEIIYDYVRRNMNSSGEGSIYCFDGIRKAWDKKIGTTSELNLLLINLLRLYGLNSSPILVSTKDNGVVNPSSPFLRQFNCTMAVVLIDGKLYVLNAADKYNPASIIPYDVVNTQAYMVDEKKSGWIVLNDDKDNWQNNVSVFAEIDSAGIMNGEATVLSYDYSKNVRLKKLYEDKSSFKNFFTVSSANVKFDDIEIKNETNEHLPLEQKFKFSMPLSESGDYKYFNLNFFSGLEKNPFIADERHTDIDFGYKQSYKIVSKIFLPDGFETDELPKNIKMIMPDTSIIFNRMMQKDDNSIDVIITINFVKPFYEAGMYGELKEFYKKLFAALDEQVVIKKK